VIELKALCPFLDGVFDKSMVDYCLNGLQVEGKNKISKIATAVSANIATIEAAIEAKADALIVHHGLFWNKDSYGIIGTKKTKLSLILQHDLSLFAYHLPMDSHPEIGNNWKAAKDMGWKNLSSFCDIGVKGEIAECSPEEFKQRLEQYYRHAAVCVSGGKKRIKTAALISGGAHKQIEQAIEAGVDAFITGSFDEPTWHQALEGNIHFFALGHSATERIGPKALADYLNHTLSIPTVFLDIENPF